MKRAIWRENVGGAGLTVMECADGPRSSCVYIAPAYGGNLCRWTVDGNRVIDFDAETLLARGYTGTPVLYPTPSLVRGGELHFRGRVFRHRCDTRPGYEHGLVHDLPWEAGEPQETPDGVSMTMWVAFEQGAAVFEAFPFPHSFWLTYTVGIDFVRADWRIENRGGGEIPFGFGLHPYFQKLAGERGTRIRLPAQTCMEADADLLPTGRMVNLAGQSYDAREFRSVGELELDHVFTDLIADVPPAIAYDSPALRVELTAGPGHTHLVCWSPRGEQYFCIENYTCSTDAHNMHDRGYVRESGLKFVPPHGEYADSICFAAIRG